jgi:hypothetical protein
MTLRTAPGTCRPRAKAYPKQVTGRVRQSIYDSALTFGIPYTILLKIAQCESALDPRASDGVHFGLFQFLPDTFDEGSANLRVMTGITTVNFWRPLDSSYVAGFLFATGQSPRWQCETQSG